ncbi:MAG: LysR substrate-binding domain-containing protein [Polaromonas sp.]
MPENVKRLPPLNCIVAFEAAARLLSFTRAAEELHLSQAAVSRQVQGLEGRLGTTLFHRRHKELKLTRAGLIFHETIGNCLAQIRRTVLDIERLESQSVTIAASVALSSFWLLPAILEFREIHPSINIRVLANDELIDPRREAVDLAVRYGDGKWPGVVSEKLFDETIFPVCSPRYLQRRGINKIADFSQEKLIDFDKPISPFGSWQSWLKQAHIKEFPLHASLTLSNYDLVYRAVCNGEGVGLTWAYVVPVEARDNLLVRPTDLRITTGFAEYVVLAAGERLSESANTVLEWLLDYAKRSLWG